MISSWRKRRAERHAAKKQDREQNGGMEPIMPRHFLCPISLDLMKDPVTLSSGITYDRENIEKWIEAGNHTCPITNQVLTSLEPIPNHAIRIMIQDWCVENKSYGIERIPTPRTPVSAFQVSEILSKIAAAREEGDAEGCKELVLKIKALAKESERNKKCIVVNGTGKVLSATFQAFSKHFLMKNIAGLDEILSAVTIMSPLGRDSMSFLGSTSSLSCIIWFLNCGDLSARRNAILVLKDVVLSSDQHQVNEVLKIEGALEGLVKLIKVPISPTTTKASLLTMYHMVSSSSSSANEKATKKFVELGLVEMLLEMLVDSEKSICEKALGVLDGICSFAEGREKAYENAIAVPVLVKKLFLVSDLATEFSVSILWKLAKNEINGDGCDDDVLIEALQVGAFQKLLLLLQVGCTETTKEKVTELLKLLNLHRYKTECIDSVDFKDLKRPF